MAGGLVVHITNGQERRTEVLSQERVLIGPGEMCHIRLGSDMLTDSSVLLELSRLPVCVLHRHILPFRFVMGETKHDGPM